MRPLYLYDFVMNYAPIAEYVLLERRTDNDDEDAVYEELALMLFEDYAADYCNDGFKHAEDLHLDSRTIARLDAATDPQGLPVLVIILE